jgi:hypothetical protein
MSDAALLAELARLESVEALTVGDGDHLAGTVPGWCELVLNIEDGKGTRQLQLTRHDAELIIEVLWTVLHPNEHRASPVQRLWSELDDVMDFLMDADEPEDEDKARAKALALSIALISQPHSDEPDVAAVRDEAVARWEQRAG